MNPTPKRPTLRDVGRLAGVDASIASRVLGGEERRVSPETRDRILEAAHTLGWRVHPGARALRRGTSSTIAVVIPDLLNPAYGAMIQGAQRAAADADHAAMFADTSEHPDRAGKEIQRLSAYVDGVVFASAQLDVDLAAQAKALSVPLVLLNRSGVPGVPAVVGRDEDGVALAVDHLLALGHERIGIVTGPSSVDTALRRRLAFEKTLAAHGRHLDAELWVEAELNVDAAAAALRPVLLRPPSARPTAVFAAALTAALGALRAAESVGLRVPEDLSIVGFDDAEVASLVTPALTTIRMPHRAMGIAAVELLLKIMAGESSSTGTHLVEDGPELVLRHSTAARAAPGR